MQQDNNIVAIHENHDLFIVSLILLLDIIKRKTDLTNANKLIEDLIEERIDVDRKSSIIKKVFMLIDIYFDLLKTNDNKLFSLYSKQNNKVIKITIIPNIDIDSIWNKLDTESQSKIWSYLKYMYIFSSHMVINSGNNIANLEKINELHHTLSKNYNELYTEFWEKFPDNKIIPKPSFNPFVGVGKTNPDYGINDLLSGPKLLPNQVSPGIEGLTQMLGIDKMINLQDLSKQLKNITKEQIDEATKSIKSLLGSDVDENTSDMISMMLSDIKEELSKDNPVADSNPIQNFIKIAETVAHRVMPKIDPKKVDMKKVLNSTKNIATKCQDKNGKPIFNGPNNPLSLLTNLMERELDKSNKNNTNTDKNKMTDADYAKECQNMLKQFGLPNISAEQLQNLPMDKLFENKAFNQATSQATSQASKRSKKRNRHK